jgi:hypothetical protein
MNTARSWPKPLAMLIAALAGLVIYVPLVGEPRPGDRVDLRSSPWAVNQVDGARVTGMVTLRFDEHVDFGDLGFHCGALRFEYSRDTDGAAFGFGEVAYEGGTCTDAVNVRNVLPRVSGWRAPSSDAIEFYDESGTTLIAATRSNPAASRDVPDAD